MSEPTSQAAPQEPVTPESAQVPEFTPEATGSTPAEPQTEQKPLTLEDYRRIAREEATKISQSQVAKGESRIRKEIQAKFDALEQTRSTLQLSDDQVAQAKQKIVAEAYSSKDEEPPTEQQQTDVETETDDPIHYMNTQLKIVFDNAGQLITRTDPEFGELQQTINQAWTDPNGLTTILLAANRLANAKATRLRAREHTAAGRVVGGGQPSSGQAPPASSAHDAWENAYKKA